MPLASPLKLPASEFLDSFKNVPRVAINILVIDSENQLLLTRRNIPPFPYIWHFPGSLLLKNESIRGCQKRVMQDELGYELDDNAELTLIGAFDDLEDDPRGHVVDLMYKITTVDPEMIKLTDQTAEYQFFTKLPENIGFNHRSTLVSLTSSGLIPKLE